MKIALIGYGKMGRAIEKAALKRGHEVVLVITSSNGADFTTEKLKLADVAIEFTTPEAAFGNVAKCINAGVNVVCGSTGWNDRLGEIRDLVSVKGDVAFIHASNFSIGVNVFMEVNKLLARLMNGREEYNVMLEETHHIHKKDLPGGTAITIAEQIVKRLDNKSGWILDEHAPEDKVSVVAHRIDEVPGTHTVRYSSVVDEIDITHRAHSRDGFATGAIFAAEYLCGKKGSFGMSDVLGIGDS